MNQQSLENDLKEKIANGEVVVVLGTGVSSATCDNQAVDGFKVATWAGLLEHGLHYCLNIKNALEENELAPLLEQIHSGKIDQVIAVADLVTKKLLYDGSSGGFYRWLLESVGKLKYKNPGVIQTLAAWPVILATLNYDGLIEQVTNRKAVTWKNSYRVENILRGKDKESVLHLHGYFEEPESVVLDQSSYIGLTNDAHAQAVQQFFTLGHTLLFVGCGGTFDDPNFSQLIEWGKKALEKSPARHYVLCSSEEIDFFIRLQSTAKWLYPMQFNAVSGTKEEGLLAFLQQLYTPPPKPGPDLVADIDRLQGPVNGDLIGRTTDKVVIDEALKSNKTGVLGIIADGGVGKTALVADWLDKLDKENYGLTHVYAWSFYDIGKHESTTSGEFFDNVFASFKTPAVPGGIQDEEKPKLLCEDFYRTKKILVLDGLESFQDTYGIDRGKIKKDLVIRSFLRKVIEANKEKKDRLIIVTSRLPLTDFNGRPGYYNYPLKHLEPKDGAELLTKLGVTGTDEDKLLTSEENKGHCLSLVLLGKLLFNRFADKNVKNRYEIYSLTSLENIPQTDDESYWKQARRIMTYYEQVVSEKPDKILLQMMGLFHAPMKIPERQRLLDRAIFAKVHDCEWRTVESKLEKYGLLLAEKNASFQRTQWDCHPLVREHFRETLKQDAKAWTDAHQVLFHFFKDSAPNYPVFKLDFISLYRAIHHGCEAKLFKESLDLYRRRILRGDAHGYSTNQKGLYSEDVAALERFFDTSSCPDKGLSTEDIDFLWGRMAFSLTGLGRLGEAIGYRKKEQEYFIHTNYDMGVASASEYLSSLFVMKGLLTDAKAAAETAKVYAEKANDWGQKMRANYRLGVVSYLRGDIENCADYFREAKQLQEKKVEPTKPELHSDYGIYYRLYKLDVASPEDYEGILHDAEGALKWDEGNWHVPSGLDMLVKAIYFSTIGDETSAQSLFVDAKDLLIKKSGSIVYQPMYFLAYAEFHRRWKRWDDALDSVKEARCIATEYNMPLFLIDANLLKARIHLGKNEIQDAKNLLETAENDVKTYFYFLRSADMELIRGEIALMENRKDAREILETLKDSIQKRGPKSLLKRLNESLEKC